MGKRLKAALKSQQSRLKAKEKAQKAAHAVELKGKKPSLESKSTAQSWKSKGKTKEKAHNKIQQNQRPTIPFRPTDKILLVGEGDFSFARALVTNQPPGLNDLPPNNVTATAYDTEEECHNKYPDAEGIVKMLGEQGVELLFGVDATKLEKTPGFKGRKWDRIVWNFPHAGACQFSFFCRPKLMIRPRQRHHGSRPKYPF
jgi:25S rRNA (uracil2634-N3)-methyltransferase